MTSIKEEKTLAALTLAAHCTTLVDVPMHVIAKHTLQLQKLAASLHKRYEAACSHQWADTDKYRANTLKLEQRAIDAADALGLAVEFQTDPRGWPLILSNGSETADKWSIRLG